MYSFPSFQTQSGQPDQASLFWEKSSVNASFPGVGFGVKVAEGSKVGVEVGGAVGVGGIGVLVAVAVGSGVLDGKGVGLAASAVCACIVTTSACTSGPLAWQPAATIKVKTNSRFRTLFKLTSFPRPGLVFWLAMRSYKFHYSFCLTETAKSSR